MGGQWNGTTYDIIKPKVGDGRDCPKDRTRTGIPGLDCSHPCLKDPTNKADTREKCLNRLQQWDTSTHGKRLYEDKEFATDLENLYGSVGSWSDKNKSCHATDCKGTWIDKGDKKVFRVDKEPTNGGA